MFTTNKVSKSLLDAVAGIVTEDKDCVTKPEAKTIAKKEVGKHEKGMHGSKGDVAKHEKKMHGEETEQVTEMDKSVDMPGGKEYYAKPASPKSVLKTAGKALHKALTGGSDEDQLKNLQKKMGVAQTGQKPKKEETEFTFKDRLLEREMSKSETKKKEDIVMGMKKNTDYLKKKYGSNWKNVMYATATKKAMGEELEQVEEQSDVSTDMLSGRVQGAGKINSFKNFKVKIEGSQKTAREPSQEEEGKPNPKSHHIGKAGEMPELDQPKIGVSGHEVDFAKQGFAEEEESGLRMAAHAANKQGKKMFSFKGKMYPITVKKEEVEQIDEGKMDKMSLTHLWHAHAKHTYGADQGWGGGVGGHHSDHAATAIENHVRKHHGNKVADDMVDHSSLHVAHAEYVGGKEAKEVERDAAKLRKKHGIKGDLYGHHDDVNEEVVKEGWDDMVKSAKDAVKSGPKPSGGSGMKQGSRYGGAKQKDKPEHDDDKMKKEEVELDEASAPMLSKHVIDTEGTTYRDKAKTHGKKLKGVISDLKKERDSIANVHGYKHVIGHDKAIRAYSNVIGEEVELQEGKDPMMDAGAGSEPNFTTTGNVTSSPVMKRVKEITKSAMGRVKNEMLGKAPGNQ